MWRCQECGSGDVEIKMFVKVNDIQQTEFEFGSVPDLEDSWCNGCESITLLKEEEEDV